ncbi:MAG: hypothetical protein ACXADY_27020, partial [Candidatus Hodarchaeales archaeon]
MAILMRAYLIITLKWAITLTLSYCIYREGHTYTAIALLWCMGWIEVIAFLCGHMTSVIQAQNHVINTLATNRVEDDVKLMEGIAKILN